jgi:hypothetical protein
MVLRDSAPDHAVKSSTISFGEGQTLMAEHPTIFWYFRLLGVVMRREEREARGGTYTSISAPQ